MTVELAVVPVRCMECGIVYKEIPAAPNTPPNAESSGYCPKCTPIVEERWFGRKLTVEDRR